MRLVAGSLLTAALAAVPLANDSVDNFVLAQLRVRNIPGVSVAVVKDGRLVKAAGYGIANLELQAPATAQTV
jgi:D-alanyl-D-alanine carboxypeptidase